MKELTPERIIQLTAIFYDITVSDMVSTYRTDLNVRARHMAMLLMRERLGMKYQAIGAYLGTRHHTTVLHGIRTAKARVKAEGAMRSAYRVLNRALDGLLIPDRPHQAGEEVATR